MSNLSYIKHYPQELKDQVEKLIENKTLDRYLISKYPKPHNITNNKTLYTYVTNLKNEFFKN